MQKTTLLKKYLFNVIFLLLSFLGFSQTSPQIFSSSGTFTVPAGVTSVTVEAWGGGGGGGSSILSSSITAGGGGSGGSYTKATVTVTPGSSITVTVGIGGIGVNNANGNDGGTSTFASAIPVSAVGGNGGKVGNQTTPFGLGGTIATGITYSGGRGGNGIATTESGGGGGGAGSGGNGGNASGKGAGAGGVIGSGSSVGGNGAAGRINDSGGNNGSANGGGGSGSYSDANSKKGGNGGNGQVIVSYIAPDIDVQGNSTSIPSGSTTPTLNNNTDFGSSNLTIPLIKTFTIKNNGGNNLLLTGGSPYVTLTGSTDFTLITPPNSSIASNANTTFSIQFKPSSTELKSATVSIANNDPDENPYTFKIQGIGDVFFDSDGDTVYDNIDIDDDNDGITDVTEETNCRASDGFKVDYKFLNETFGTGGRSTIYTTYDATTTYCNDNGSGSGPNTAACPNLTNKDLNDGEYTVGSSAQITSWAGAVWYKGKDHTGDTNGRMALFNADVAPGVFYAASITGALPNLPISYSFWVLNLDRTDADNIGTRIRPNIKVEFRDLNDVVIQTIQTIQTGDIAPCSVAGNQADDWHLFTADLNIPTSAFKVVFINNNGGGNGNDLAIDDIQITQRLCDFDGDTIPDVFDLDSDNDGIPDVVEAGFGNLSNGKGKIDVAWVDTNNNGMYDPTENKIPLNSDGDSQPNYIDLDSDNDSIFDVDESGAGFTALPTFQNGDGDINGDGTGDGPETELFRSKDSDGNKTLELFGDGILDIYDKTNGTDFPSKYGNLGQGTSNTNNPASKYLKDTDNDGIPDYLDTTSKGTGIYDIDITKSIYQKPNLDSTTRGIINNGTTDIDHDGIPDDFDTNTAVKGSPRDINTKLYLDFDGRNDYAEGKQLLSSLQKSSLMGWIKLNSSYNKNGIIMGQENFNIGVNSAKQLTLTAAGQTITFTTTALDENRWYHIAGVYDGAPVTLNTKLRLYLNGTEVSNLTSGTSNLALSTSKFTIAKSANASDNYFNGFIDEVRVFNTALSIDQIQKMMCQEINANGSSIRGNIIPKNIESSSWASLIAYYRMDIYKNDVIDDFKISGIDNSATDTNFTRIYNVKRINIQSAPMPYLTLKDGVIGTAVDDLTKTFVKGSDVYNAPGSIVKVKHTVTTASNMTNVGLIIDSGSLTVNNDSGLFNTWWLKLDGKIDLQGKSQLVQTTNSDLDVTSAGYIERDQQGQTNKFNYNYWSSPVSTINNTANNNGYTVAGVMKDGFNAIPRDINWLSTYDGIPGDASKPVSLAEYWLYKFDNKAGVYANWEHFNKNSPLRAGQGYTLKGNGGSSNNFTFVGKPNNGTINTNTVAAGQLLLVGNPYPSALKAYQFINDNATNTMDGNLYFWEHDSDNKSHNLAEYLGRYSAFNYLGGVKGIAPAGISGAGSSGKIPKQYIPVGQGFFVYGKSNGGGPVIFNNIQRDFIKEDNSSSNTLFRTIATPKSKKITNQEDQSDVIENYKKIRLGYNNKEGYHRQILLGFIDNKATSGMDYGYDAELMDNFGSDMFLLNSGKKLVISGESYFDANTILPIGVKATSEGKVSFIIDELENFDSTQPIFIHDNVTDTYHDIRTSKFEINLPATPSDSFSDRFSLRFVDKTLGLNDTPLDEKFITISHIQKGNLLEIKNQLPDTKVEKVTLFNISGQSITSWKIENQEQQNIILPIKSISSGVYIAKIKTSKGIVSKKIVIK